MSLRNDEIEALCSLFTRVCARASDEPVAELVRNAAGRLRDPSFAFDYAGVLLCNRDKLAEALDLFASSGSHFSRVLGRYLAAGNRFEPLTRVFSDRRPLAVWTTTPLYRAYLTGAVGAVVKHCEKWGPPADPAHPVIVDIGTGNGVLIAEVLNALAAACRCPGFHLVMVEPSRDMLDAAEAHCAKAVSVPLRISRIENRIQDVPPATWDTIREAGPVWFAHGAAALHHMPWAEKVDTLRKIGALCRDCLVTEFNFNNDRPEQDTPEFVFSVVSLYNTLFADVLRSPAAEEDKEACLHGFLLAEAITMLRNPRPSRIDYHATIPDWVLAADEAGCDTLGILPVVMEHGRVFLFTHVVRSRR